MRHPRRAQLLSPRPEHSFYVLTETGTFFSAVGGEPYDPRSPAVTQTRRELEVIRLVAERRCNDEIAAALGMAPKTVETHLGKVFERHDIASRTELAARATGRATLNSRRHDSARGMSAIAHD